MPSRARHWQPAAARIGDRSSERRSPSGVPRVIAQILRIRSICGKAEQGGRARAGRYDRAMVDRARAVASAGAHAGRPAGRAARARRARPDGRRRAIPRPARASSCSRARGPGRNARWTYLTADPVAVIEAPSEGADPFANARRLLARLATDRGRAIPRAPPFLGGLAGFLGYDLGRRFERLPSLAVADQELPVLRLALHDWVIAWDRRDGRAWLGGRAVDERIDRLDRPARGGPRAGARAAAATPPETDGGGEPAAARAALRAGPARLRGRGRSGSGAGSPTATSTRRT